METINRLYLLPDGNWQALLRNKQGAYEGQNDVPQHQDCVEVWTQLYYARFDRFFLAISRSYVNRDMEEGRRLGIKVLPEEEIIRLRNLKRPPDFVVPKTANIVDLVGEEIWKKLGREPRQPDHEQPHTFSKDWEISASEAGRTMDLLGH